MKEKSHGTVVRRHPSDPMYRALIIRIRGAGSEFGLLLFLGLLTALATMIQPRFIDPANLRDVLTQAADSNVRIVGDIKGRIDFLREAHTEMLDIEREARGGVGR